MVNLKKYLKISYLYLYNWTFDENNQEKIQRITKNVYKGIYISSEEYFTTSEQISIQRSLNELHTENASLLFQIKILILKKYIYLVK